MEVLLRMFSMQIVRHVFLANEKRQKNIHLWINRNDIKHSIILQIIITFGRDVGKI